MSKKKLKVDVILVYYKCNDWIFETIDSVVNQTYSNWQLKIVDNGSNDNWLDKIQKRYKKLSKKISYIKLKKNLKPAGARMVAIKQMNGDLICTVDADDVWHKEKLMKSVNYLNSHDNIKLVHSNIYCIDEDSNVVKNYFREENQIRNDIPYSKLDNYEMAKHLFNYYSVRLGTQCVRRKEFLQIGGFDTNLFGGEDLEYIVRFAYNYKIGHIKEKLLYRREHESNTSKASKYERLKGRIVSIKKMYKNYKFPSYNKKIAGRERTLSRCEFNNGNYLKSIQYAFSAIIRNYFY